MGKKKGGRTATAPAPTPPVTDAAPVPAPTAPQPAKHDPPQRRKSAVSVSPPPAGLSVVGLRLVWAAAISASLALFMAADAFQSFDPTFPLRPALAAAVFAHSGGMLAGIALGVATVPGYRVFQPFTGGASFIALQCVSFTAWSVTIAAAAAYHLAVLLPLEMTGAASSPTGPQRRYGVLSACGALGVAAAWLHLQSHRQFCRTAGAPAQGGTAHLAAGERLLAVVLAASGVVLCLFADTAAAQEQGLRDAAVTAFLAVHSFGGIVLHVLAGWRHTPGYRLFQPFAGTLRTTLLAGTAWLLWAAVPFLTLLWLGGTRPFACAGLGGLGFVATVALLLATQRPPEVANKRSRESAAWGGPMVLSVLCALSGAFVLASSPLVGTPEGAGLPVVYAVLLAALLAAPPLSQIAGRLLHGPRFDPWRPLHCGERDFVLTQAVSWTAYSAGVLAVAVESPGGPLLVAPALLVGAQLGIHSSLRLYGGGHGPLFFFDASPARGSRGKRGHHAVDDAKPQPAAHGPSSSSREADTAKVPPQLFAALALVSIALVLRLATDVVRLRGDSITIERFPTAQVLAFANVMWAVAGPVAHLALHRPGDPLFAPFRGSPEYVALQATGWTLYSLQLLLFLLATADLLLLDRVTTAADTVAATQGQGRADAGRRYPFALTADAVISAIPVLLIGWSTLFKDRPSALAPSQQQRQQQDRQPNNTSSASNGPAVDKAGSSNDSDVAAAVRALSPKDAAALVAAARASGSQHALALALAAERAVTPAPPPRPPLIELEPTVEAHGKGRADYKGIAWEQSSDGHAGIAAVLTGSLAAGVAILALAADVARETNKAHTAVLAALAVVASAGTCAGLHMRYGRHRYGAVYRAWMPFEGGPAFVASQLGAGTSFATGLLLAIVGVTAPGGPRSSDAEEAHAVSLLLPAGAFLAIAPPLALAGVHRFSPEAATAGRAAPTFFEQHAEGVVAVLIFAGGWVASGAVPLLAPADDAAPVSDWAAALPALVVSVMAVLVAVPLAIFALRKSAVKYAERMGEQLDRESSTDDADALLPDDNQHHKGGRGKGKGHKGKDKKKGGAHDTSTATSPLVLGELLAVASFLTLPFLAYCVYHYVAHNYVASALAVVRSSQAVAGVGVCGLLFTLASRGGWVRTPLFVIDAWSAASAFFVYNVPAMIAITSVGLLVFRGTPGAVVWGNLVGTVSPAPIRKALVWLNVAALSYLTYAATNAGAAALRADAGRYVLGETVTAWLLPDFALTAAETAAAVSMWVGVFETVETALFVAFWVGYHALLFRGKPHETGAHYCPNFCAVFGRWVMMYLEHYFTLRIVLDHADGTFSTFEDLSIKTGSPKKKKGGKKKGHHDDEAAAAAHAASSFGGDELDSMNSSMCSLGGNRLPPQVLFGYHPHGVVPYLAPTLPHLPRFQRMLTEGDAPPRHVPIHAASVVFQVPGLRDFAMATGGRAVTRSALHKALDQGHSPMLVPGGQAEMIRSRPGGGEFAVVAHHRGFLRLALERGVPVVPVLSLGETSILLNVRAPRMQRYTLDRFGFGFPMFPYGRWWLPLPRAVPVTIVVGAALDLRAHPAFDAAALEAGSGPAYDRMVDAMADTYFAQIQGMCLRHRDAAGYPDMTVRLVHSKKDAL